MALVKLKPTSAGRRHAVKVVNKELHKGKPWAALTEKKNRGSGRNNNGHITCRQGRRCQARLSYHRLQAPEGRCARPR